MRPSWLSELFFGAWFVILMNGMAIVVTEECSGDQHPVYTTTGRICCQKCKGSVKQEPCDHEKMECRCHPGYGCQTKSCTECNELPKCKSGERLSIKDSASSRYIYSCEKCPPQTVLDMDSGQCVPSEMPTTTTLRSHITTQSNDFNNFNTWTFICVFVVSFLLLLTVVIHLLIQKIKTEKSLKMEGDHVQPHTNIPINTKDEVDTWSYQYPEEEHGDGAPNNKLAAF